jgi:hypothetical protein
MLRCISIPLKAWNLRCLPASSNLDTMGWNGAGHYLLFAAIESCMGYGALSCAGQRKRNGCAVLQVGVPSCVVALLSAFLGGGVLGLGIGR